MRLASTICSALALTLLVGCGDNRGPDAAWVGIWELVSVDGQSLPATISWSGTQRTVEDQTLFTQKDHGGLWVSIADQGIGGSATITWSVTSNTLSVSAVSGSGEGNFPVGWEFAKQSDGSLLRIEQGHTFRYQKG